MGNDRITFFKSSLEYVLAVIQGIIDGAFKPLEWKEAIAENFPEFHEDIPGRIGFIGSEAELEIKNMYLRKKRNDFRLIVRYTPGKNNSDEQNRKIFLKHTNS